MRIVVDGEPAATDVQNERRAQYEDFLRSEYEQIATAYFKAVETLTSFFKHYLVIAALPLSLFGLMFSDKLSANASGAVKFATPFVSLAVAFIGTFVLCYLSNL